MSSATTHDVIVVGAGLSGLQAAVDVQRAGFSCVILEANDRIGGKVFSVPNLPGSSCTVDVGAAWINDTSQSRMWALGQKHGAEFEKQVEEADDLLDIGDGNVLRLPYNEHGGTAEEGPVIEKLIGTMYEVGAAIKEEGYAGPMSQELDKPNFREWVFKQADGLEFAVALADLVTRALVGADADELSALYMLKYIENGTGFVNLTSSGKDGAQYLRPYQGSSTYVRGLAGELTADSIRISCPVTKIRQNDEHCIVSTSASDHVYTAKKVILSAPTALYCHITFDPPLPTAKKALSAATKMSYYTKLVCVYASPWWRTAGLGSGMRSLVGPIILALDTCIPSQNQFSLSLFIIDSPGRKWSEQHDAAVRHQDALDHLHRVFGPHLAAGEKIPPPLNVIEMDWAREQWFEGAPTSVYPVGALTGGGGEGRGVAAVKRPFGHIHFVGTETSDHWQGYMEGAVESGERGAREVIAALSTRERQ